MELLLDEHQRLLEDSASRLCRDLGGLLRVRSLQDADEQVDRSAWKALTQAGWSGLLVPETAGGMGLGAVELFLVQAEIGRQDVRVPIMSVAVAARELALGSGDAACEALSGALDGTLLVLPCIHGAGTPHAPAGALPRARRLGDQLCLQGRHLAVPGVAVADRLLVAAQAIDGSHLLCVIPPDAVRLAIHTRRTIDGASISDVTFDDVMVPAGGIVTEGAGAGLAMARIHAALTLAVSAELLGLGEAVMELLLTQLTRREQFGRPIGAFQALQHRAVDGFITLELLRSLAFRVARAIDRSSEHPAMLPALKAKAGRGVLSLTRLTMQVHGAMGYAAEHDIGLRYKRALSLSALHGGDAYQFERFSEIAGGLP